MYNYGYPNPYGPQFGTTIPTRPKPKNTQPLSPEAISRLRAKGDAFKMEVSEDDLLRASCTHKENGVPTLVEEGQGQNGPIVRCTICGEVFEMIDVPVQQVEEAVNLIYNLLQTSKTMYLDAPVELVRQYYQILPLLQKFPKLYERSQKNFNFYSTALTTDPTTGVAGSNGFQMMGAMLSNPYGTMYGGYPPQAAQPQTDAWGRPIYQQPPYPPYGAPQQPVTQPYYPPAGGTAQAGYDGNPMMYGAPPAPAPTPAPAPGTVPPAQPPVSGEVSQQKQFDV